MKHDELWKKIVSDCRKVSAVNYNASGKVEPSNSVGRKRIRIQPRYELCGKVRGNEAVYV